MQTVRYLIDLTTGFIAGNRVVDAIRSWREWHTWAVREPSGADPFRTFFMVDATISTLSLLIAGLVWWLLRPKSPQGTGA